MEGRNYDRSQDLPDGQRRVRGGREIIVYDIICAELHQVEGCSLNPCNRNPRGIGRYGAILHGDASRVYYERGRPERGRRRRTNKGWKSDS